jgi:hypothetical protein
MENLEGELKALAALVAMQVAWRWQEVRLPVSRARGCA